MIRYDIEKLTPGMIVGEPVYDQNQKMLVGKGFILKDQHIEILKKQNVATLLIEVEGTEEVVPETVVSQETRNELAKVLKRAESSLGSVIDQKSIVQDRVQQILRNKKSEVNQIIRNSGSLEAVNKVIDDIIYEDWTLINLDKILHSGNDLYDHSINMTIIATCLGYKFGFNQEDLKNLALGAINADIGLTTVPKEIIEKGRDRTPEEEKIYQKHTIHGYLMLSENTIIPPTSAIVALSHHEYQDGSGYPQHLKGSNALPVKRPSQKGMIHRFAEIVSVADKYIDLLHKPEYKDGNVNMDEVIRDMISLKVSKLNFEILKKLLTTVAVFPIGSQVKLVKSPIKELDGAYGVVAKVIPGKIMQPVIILVETKNHTRLQKPLAIDLSQKTGFAIELQI